MRRLREMSLGLNTDVWKVVMGLQSPADALAALMRVYPEARTYATLVRAAQENVTEDLNYALEHELIDIGLYYDPEHIVDAIIDEMIAEYRPNIRIVKREE